METETTTGKTPTPECTNMQSENGLNEYEGSYVKKLRSSVWDDMERIEQDGDDARVRCKHCKKTFSGSSSNGTSHLKRYINSCQKRRIHDIRQYKLGSNAKKVNVRMCTQDELRSSVITFLICGKHHFTIVEDIGFRYMMSKCCPDFKNISRHTARREMLSLYVKERDVVKEELLLAPSRISLTSDNWRAEYTDDEYICITAHWIDINWKLQKRIIRSKSLIPPFGGISMADEIGLCLTQWGLDGKILCITLDNASYNDVVANSLKIHYLAKNELLCGGSFFQIRCCAHILNLIVQSGLNSIEFVIGKIRNGIKYIKKSVPRQKRFYDMAQRKFLLNTSKKLRLDVCVRWNSTYIMLDHALYYKNVLNYWSERYHNFQFDVLEEEWRRVEEIHHFLKVFYEVTCMFSGTNYPTANLYFKGVWRVHCRLVEILQDPNNFMCVMMGEMLRKFLKYWSDYSSVLACTAILDPRCKLDYVKFCYNKLYGDSAEEHVDKIVRTLYELFDEYKKNSAAKSSSNVSVGPSELFPCEDDDFRIWKKTTKAKSNKISQLDKYLEADENVEFDYQLNILDFWSQNSVRYPELAMMASDILAIPISTVASESSFSIGKKVINPCRSSLKSKSVQALVCYEDWMRARGFSLGDSGILTMNMGSSIEDSSSSGDENDEDDVAEII